MENESKSIVGENGYNAVIGLINRKVSNEKLRKEIFDEIASNELLMKMHFLRLLYNSSNTKDLANDQNIKNCFDRLIKKFGFEKITTFLYRCSTLSFGYQDLGGDILYSLSIESDKRDGYGKRGINRSEKLLSLNIEDLQDDSLGIEEQQKKILLFKNLVNMIPNR